MVVDASPMFRFRTKSFEMEVVRFTLYHWGISREYYLDLTIRNPKVSLNLAEAACLQVDDHYFHGLIASITETHSDQIQELKIRLLSPLTYYLQQHHTRIYSQQPLKTIIQMVLSESGLREGEHFELRLASSSSKKLWYYQDNEPTLAFLQRLLASNALVYCYEQTQHGTCCIISDSLKSILPAKSISLPLQPPTGLHQENEISALDACYQLCPKTISACVFEPDTAVPQTKQAQSCHSYAIGEMRLNGYQPPMVSSVKQSILDEEAQQLKLTMSSLQVLPGQEVILQHSILQSVNYQVCHLEIMGIQEQGIGSRNSTENVSLHHARLRVIVTLSTDFSGLPLQEFSPYARLHTAEIEHRSGAYPDLSEKGEYHIRLHQDESPGSQSLFEAAPKSKASLWVRNALYFSGHYYGHSHPFQDGSEVLVTFENGHPERPLILGALPNLANLSVVTKKNSKENIISTQSGSLLQFHDHSNERFLELCSEQAKNYLRLKQGQQNTSFTLQSTSGEIILDALESIHMMSEEQYCQKANVTQRIWVDTGVNMTSQEGYLYVSAKETISLRHEQRASFIAIDQRWYAQEHVRLKARKILRIQANKSLVFVSKTGRQTWQSNEGGIYLSANQSLNIKGGGASLIMTPDHVQLVTDKNLNLKAAAILGLDNN